MRKSIRLRALILATAAFGLAVTLGVTRSGVRSVAPVPSAQSPAILAHASLDNGSANLTSFGDVTGGNTHDWAGDNHDAFDASASANNAEPVAAVDLPAVQGISWTTPVVKPASLGVLVIGAAGLLATRRRLHKISA